MYYTVCYFLSRANPVPGTGRQGQDGSRDFWVPQRVFCVPLRDMMCTILSVISLAGQIQCPQPWTGRHGFLGTSEGFLGSSEVMV